MAHGVCVLHAKNAGLFDCPYLYIFKMPEPVHVIFVTLQCCFVVAAKC